jgi:hypothetical protein
MVCVGIYNEPPQGAATVEGLSRDVREAMRQQDADRLQNLFAKDTVADDYAENLLDRLGAARMADRATPTLAEVSGDQALVLRDAGQAICMPWLVTKDHDRWYLDGVPPVSPAFCPSR